ncbi:MAG: hypothetical protein ACRC8R_12160 [Aeromonas hydrophila]
MRGMILKCVKKLPEPVARFMLERVLLGFLVWALALVVAIVGCLLAPMVMLAAIFDPLRAADMIHRFGEELVK